MWPINNLLVTPRVASVFDDSFRSSYKDKMIYFLYLRKAGDIDGFNFNSGLKSNLLKFVILSILHYNHEKNVAKVWLWRQIYWIQELPVASPPRPPLRLFPGRPNGGPKAYFLPSIGAPSNFIFFISWIRPCLNT